MTLGPTPALAAAITYLISGAAKAADLELTAHTFRRLRLLPASMTRVVSVLLPLAELTVGLGLLYTPAVRTSALASLLLVCGFIVVNLLAIRRREEMACSCFGGLMPGRLGGGGLAHAVLLGVLNVMAAIDPDSLFPWHSGGLWLDVMLVSLPTLCLVQLGFLIRLADLV